MEISPSVRVTFNPFDTNLKPLPQDLFFQAFWSNNSQELSQVINEEDRQGKIPRTCFPEDFISATSSNDENLSTPSSSSGDDQLLSFLGVHLSSRTSGVQIQVGVFSSSKYLVILFQYEVMTVSPASNGQQTPYHYSYTLHDGEAAILTKTYRLNETNIIKGTTCSEPSVYLYPHQRSSASTNDNGEVVAIEASTWIPPHNPFLRYVIQGGAAQPNQPETIRIGDSSMTVRNNIQSNLVIVTQAIF